MGYINENCPNLYYDEHSGWTLCTMYHPISCENCRFWAEYKKLNLDKPKK